MADDGIFPLLLIAGAGYIVWKYMMPSTPDSITTTPSSAIPGPSQPPIVRAPLSTPRSAYLSPATNQPPANRGYFPAARPPIANADDPYANLKVDTSVFRPQPMEVPVFNPEATPNMTEAQLDFQRRCTYIDGSWKPGCQ